MRALLLLLLATPLHADPLSGKSYIIQLSSSQYASGYGTYLLPPLTRVLKQSGMIPRNGPGADVVVNVETGSDQGRWVGKVWTYRITALVGISPENYDIPFDGTPAFGVTAVLNTPASDSQAQMDCLIALATRTALQSYRPEGAVQTDGSSCLTP